VFGSLLRTIGLIACAVVLLSWGAFAIEEVGDASKRSREQVQGNQAATEPAPSARQEKARERAHSPVREALDDANDFLLKPFAAVASDAESAWVRRTVPLLLALLLYGLVLGYLARYLAVR